MHKTPSDDLTPEQRFKQVAGILAKGVIRCKRHLGAVTAPSEQVSSESPPRGLAIPGKTRLSVSRCIGG